MCFSVRFYLGGPTSVRGFGMYSIGPQSEGKGVYGHRTHIFMHHFLVYLMIFFPLNVSDFKSYLIR